MKISNDLGLAFRRRSRFLITGELFFVLLPFLISGVISIYKQQPQSIFANSELSLAATILSGQTLVKLTGGLLKYLADKPTNKIIWEAALLWILLIFSIALFCLLTYATIQLLEDYTGGILFVQMLLFLISGVGYFLIGGYGQILLDHSGYQE